MKQNILNSIAILVISFFFLSCNSVKKIEAHNISADFYIGGFLGTSYIVQIKNQQLSYFTRRRGIKSKEQKQTLSLNDLKQLEKKLIELKVNQWRKEYRNPHIMDGTQWAIQYTSNTLQINSHGSNLFPNNFKKLKKYISQTLLKGKVFQ